MVQTLISVKIDEKWLRRKRYLEVSWRYLIGKGLIHVDECAPREAELANSYNAILKSRFNARMLYALKTQHPKIYDKLILEVSNVK